MSSTHRDAAKEKRSGISRKATFSWISAISLGSVLSLGAFITGSNNLDSMLVDIGLRSAANSDYSYVFDFGDVSVAVNSYSVVNLDPKGIPAKGVSVAVFTDGTQITVRTNDPIAHPNELAVDDGGIYVAELVNPNIKGAERIFFCNVTAKFRYGIPIYHYHTGEAYQPREIGRFNEKSHAGDPYYLAALQVVRENGVQASSAGKFYEATAASFYSKGITTNWGYCDGFGAPLNRD